MRIIPVVDLLGGYAVAAKRGERQSYRPLSTPLCRKGDPFELVARYRELSDTVYLADLDALLGRPPQNTLIRSLKRAFREITFWIDQGWPPPLRDRQTVPVVGSESLTPMRLGQLRTLPDDWILSLDFRRRLLGPPGLLSYSELWPERVIVMALERIGGRKGPDFKRLLFLRKRYPKKRWIAAGGIRHRGDLKRLERIGVDAALVATALHRGELP